MDVDGERSRVIQDVKSDARPARSRNARLTMAVADVDPNARPTPVLLSPVTP